MVLSEVSVLSLEGKILVSENGSTFEVHELDVLDVVNHFQSQKDCSVYLFEGQQEVLDHHKKYFGDKSLSYKSLTSYISKIEEHKRRIISN